jgi:hypothetical protein
VLPPSEEVFLGETGRNLEHPPVETNGDIVRSRRQVFTESTCTHAGSAMLGSYEVAAPRAIS